MILQPFFKGNLRKQHIWGSTGAASPGVSVTTGGTAATKGTPVEIYAATSFDAYWVRVTASEYAGSAAASCGCLDILIGAATEEVLIPNLLMGNCGGALATNTPYEKVWDFPLYIPAGSRIAAQVAGDRTTTAMRVGVTLYGGNGVPMWNVGTKVTTYGVSSVPNGVAITPGATGAEGAWTEITASTSADHISVSPSLQIATDTNWTARYYSMDIGYGAATEEEIGEAYLYLTSANESMGGPRDPFPVIKHIPSGSRLVARVSNSGANESNYEAALHCVS